MATTNCSFSLSALTIRYSLELPLNWAEIYLLTKNLDGSQRVCEHNVDTGLHDQRCWWSDVNLTRNDDRAQT